MAQNYTPKPIHEQTMVITGASSGIGMSTAKMAAEKGAKVFMIARNGDALEKIAHDIREAGGDCDYRVADVANEHELSEAAQQCVQRFGGFDTWVNNAGVTVYGKIEDVTIDDHRRLFETNFWGLVHGCRIAAARFREHGGSILNIGSTLSDRAIPLQGMYVASKHAVKGFTDSLRMELEKDEAPVSVVLIKPASIDTLYTEHAKSYLDEEPKNPQPVYAPEVAARCIIHCAQHPRRDTYVGSAARGFSLGEMLAPRLTDHAMEWTLFDAQHSGKPASPSRDDALYRPTTGARERSGQYRFVRKHSVYTKAEHHPLVATAAGFAALGAIAAIGYTLSDASKRKTGKHLGKSAYRKAMAAGGLRDHEQKQKQTLPAPEHLPTPKPQPAPIRPGDACQTIPAAGGMQTPPT